LGLEGGVPGTRAQFQSDAPAFITQVSGNRGVAVKALIGAADGFLLGAAVVHREGVEVQPHKAAVRRDGGFGAFEQAQAEFVGVLAQFATEDIEPLTQPFGTGHLGDVQRFTEKAILAEGFDGFKVVLAQAQETHHALDDVGGLHAARYRQPSVQPWGSTGHFKALADQRQSGIGGQLVAGFLHLKTRHDQIG